MTASERRELVEKIMLSAVKARSNAREHVGDDEVASFINEQLDPALWRGDELNFVVVCERVLRGNREVTPIDLVNVLHLLNKSTPTQMSLALRWGITTLPTLEEIFA